MKRKGIFNITVLLLCAMIWGFAFSAQSVGARFVGPWTFLAARAWLGVATLLVFMGIRKILISHTAEGYRAYMDRQYTAAPETGSGTGRVLLIAGISTGALLCFASVVQQAGIAYTSVAKSSFITALYVVIVPILSSIAGRRPGARIWIAVVLSISGLYLLSFSGGPEGINTGDLMMIACACIFSLQIMTINHYVDRLDGLKLSCMEFLFEGVIATAGMLIFERPDPASLIPAFSAILYAGIMSNGVAYTLQVIGQRDFDPTIASLCMCMESVFGAIGGYFLLGQRLSTREMSGCALMFFAILIAEIPLENVIEKIRDRS